VKILFLTNNKVSAPLFDWLTASGGSGDDEVVVWEDRLGTLDIGNIKPDFIVSYSYKHIIRPEVLSMIPQAVVNLHISLLPFNRGADPNAWSFLENTPKGVSIHLIDAGIDTGPVLVQKEIFFDECSESLGHTYEVLHEEIQALFRGTWHQIRNRSIRPVPQTGPGTYHHSREFLKIKDELLANEGYAVTIEALRRRYSLLMANKASSG
jgi:methionyl-tRNA formyltransferase